MSLLLAPYNNAMRLGKGFNSYTQHICVDDAVVVDPNRAENVVTNDGTTMRIVAQSAAKPSAWNRQREVLLDDRAKHAVILSKRREPDEEEASELYHIGVDESAASKPAAASSETKPGATEPVREIADTTSDATAEAETALAAPADKGGEPTGSSIDNNFGKEDATPAGAAVDNEDSEGSMQKIEHTDLDESPPSGFPTSGEPVPKDDTVNSERPDIDLYSQNEDANVDLEAYKRDQATDAAEMKDEKTDLDLYAQNTTSKVDLDTYKANQTAIASKSEDVGTKATPAAGSRGRASSVGGKTTRDPVTSTSRKATKPAAADLTSHKAAAVAQDQRSATRFADNAKAAAAKSRQDKQFELQIAAEEKALIEKEEKARLAEQRARQLEIEKETREEDRKRREEDRLEQSKIREEKRLWDADRREATRKAINSAVDLKAASLQDLEKVRAQNQFAERFSGMVENQEAFTFDPTAPRGPSQTVQYTSKFIDRLSDITDDMCVSGSLSIKAAKFGGSGRGSFVDSDKFKSSDLNFYISVKVINQTINFKDALTFNQLRSVGLDSEKFPEVYGDSFISGFLEGGEFNAVVSMKILNKAKMLDIKAEAKVALTTGPVDITAEANIGVARSNIDTNTETTIQVSWCGGGHIKPMEQQWDIKSLMSAASRFPDLVSECPQRTYAILTKYDTLRSFVALRPAEYSPLQYENAQMYTNALMDSFMTYKSLYKDLGEQIYTVQGKTLEIVSWEERDSENPPSSEVTPDSPTSDATTDPKDDLTRFEASLRGLSDARKAIRAQMTEIVNEVDVIEKDPKKATDKGHVEPYQSPVTFQTRLPEVRVPGNLRPKINPLTGKRIMAKPQTEEELEAELKEEEKAAQAPALYSNDEQMDMNTEKSVFDSLKTSRPGIGENLRVTTAVGATDNGEFFNNLDFIQKDWHVKSIRIEIARGAVAAIEVWYENGLLLRKGMGGIGHKKELGFFQPGERITFASVEHGVFAVKADGKKTDESKAKESEKEPVDGKKADENKTTGESQKEDLRVLSVRLYTNHGRRLIAQAKQNDVKAPGKVEKDGVLYERVQTTHTDCPISKGTLKGFFGRADETTSQAGGILRLGIVWGDVLKALPALGAEADAPAQAYDYLGQADRDDVDSAQRMLAEKNSNEIAVMQSELSRKDKALQETITANAEKNSHETAVMQSELARKDKALQETITAMNEKERALQKVLNQSPVVVAAQSGTARPSNWVDDKRDNGDLSRIKFSSPLLQPPRLLYGLSHVDQQAQERFTLRSEAIDITCEAFTLNTFTAGGARSYKPTSHWLTLPENDIHFETGISDTYDRTRSDNNQMVSSRVSFSRHFKSTPSVVSWLYEVNIANGWRSLRTDAVNVDSNHFDLRIHTWANRNMDGARAGWVAIDDNGCKARAKTGSVTVSRAERDKFEHVEFGGPAFSKTPAVFIALAELDAGEGQNTRLRGEVTSVTETGFQFTYGTWAGANDHNMDHARWIWVAAE